tara:strand:+ start:400 stop:609 length:210 start_codon:yes stop_codon:yes gene_type:complete
MSEPNNWVIFDCQHCYKRAKIAMEDGYDTEDRFCPNCGISSEPFDDYDSDYNKDDDYGDDYDDEYNEYG